MSEATWGFIGNSDVTVSAGTGGITSGTTINWQPTQWTWYAPSEEKKMLSFTVDGKKITVETDKPFIKVSRLRQLAGVEGGVLYIRTDDENGDDTAVDVFIKFGSGVIFPDGDEFYTEAYLNE